MLSIHVRLKPRRGGWSSDGFQLGGFYRTGQREMGQQDGQVPTVLTARERLWWVSDRAASGKFISSIGGDKKKPSSILVINYFKWHCPNKGFDY